VDETELKFLIEAEHITPMLWLGLEIQISTGWRKINRNIYFSCDNDGKQAVGLRYSPDQIVHWLKSGLFGGQFSGSTNSDT